MFGLLIFVAFVNRRRTKAKENAKGKSDVLVMSIGGVLSYSDDPKSSYQKTLKILDDVEARKPKVLAIQINSPGGTVGASQELYDRLYKLKRLGVFVVAKMEDVAASGGLYVAMAADWIAACPGTITGSIGVIMNGWDLSSVADALSIRQRVIKSGPFKDMGSFMREMTGPERMLLQSMVDDTCLQFQEVVAESRKMTLENVRTFADGRVFNGRQAMELSVIDQVGSLQDAISVVCGALKIPEDQRNVEYLRPKLSPGERFRELLPGARLESSLQAMLPKADLQGVPLWLMRR